ncbi:MAG: PEP-CTERM sorting domain-containing protein [Phycisphaerales bacterium]
MSKNRTSIRVGVLACGVLLSASWLGQARADTVVFEDNFANSVVADSDATTGFWTTFKSNASCLVSENTASSSDLEMTATGGTGSNSATAAIYSQLSSTFSIGTQKLTFSARGLAIGGSGGLVSDSSFRFSLNDVLGSNGYTSTAGDGWTMDIFAGNTLNLGWKTGFTGGPYQHQILTNYPGSTVAAGIGGNVTGFDLTLDNTTYDLKIYGPTGTYDSTDNAAFAGTYSGFVNNNLGMYLSVSRSSSTVGNTATLLLDQWSVTQIPEPATLGLFGLGAVLMFVRRKA